MITKRRSILSIEDIDKKLDNKNIRRLGLIVKTNIRIKFACLIDGCNYVWDAFIGNIIHNDHGCPRCAKNAKLTNDIIDEKLVPKNIKRIDDYISVIIPLKLECLICKYEWRTNIRNVIRDKKSSGCPSCSGKVRLTNIIVDERLKNRNIKRLGDCKGGHTKIDFQCLIQDCNNIWSATPSNIFAGKGCPPCSQPLLNENIVLLALKENNIEFKHRYPIKKIDKLETKRYIIDFYIPNCNLIIEYNGGQHYGPTSFGDKLSKDRQDVNFINQQLRDKYIDDFCKNHNINIIWIDGRKYHHNRLKKYIIEEIIPKLK